MSITPFLSQQGVLSYLITNTQKEAILIDASFDMAQKIILAIKKQDLKLKYILDTHTHADFISARGLFKKLYPEAKVGMSKFSPTKDKDLQLEDNQILELDEIKLTIWQGHGHTNESLIYKLDHEGQTSIFTGDSLLIGGTGRTDFQAGESELLYHTLERLLTLPEQTIVYPNHNYQGQVKTTLAVEKLTNPRLKLVLEGKKQEFIDLMDNHNPPLPDLFEESIRFNSM